MSDIQKLVLMTPTSYGIGGGLWKSPLVVVLGILTAVRYQERVLWIYVFPLNHALNLMLH